MPSSSSQRSDSDVRLTSVVRFDTSTLTNYLNREGRFGRYNGTLATCDGRAGRCMQFGLNYQF